MLAEGIFRITGTEKGLACPFKPVPCEEDYCSQCPIYHDWRRLGESIVICGRCGKAVSRRAKPSGQPMISLGICPECCAKELLK